jgi:outer membrane receptor for ferric coprogen and ferric-rhodotorulic acid
MTSRLFTPWVNARLLLIACLLSPAFDSTFAQSSSTDSDAAEEIIELSPFEVNASEQDGYLASSTLGGTRLNTRLEDVAASITVVTKEFMEDIGANDAGDLLTHTAGTEVSGTRGNFTGATSSSQGAPDDIDSIRDGGQQNRVRGLTSADVSRNYFQTSIPFDGYNTQQVEINRGSNAVLFGLGSPAGIINNVTQNAVFKNRGQARLMLDSLGRVRSELNINRVIIDDTLAVRLAGVWDDRKYEQEDAFNETERFYATARFEKILSGRMTGRGVAQS